MKNFEYYIVYFVHIDVFTLKVSFKKVCKTFNYFYEKLNINSYFIEISNLIQYSSKSLLVRNMSKITFITNCCKRLYSYAKYFYLNWFFFIVYDI